MKQKPINIAIIVTVVLLLATVLYVKLTQPSNELEPAPATSLAARQIEAGQEAGESMWLLFGADTCQYCVELKKIYDRLEPEYAGKVRFINIDVDARENAWLAREYDISYIPATFIIDSAGETTYVQVGLMPEEELRAELDKVVK